MAVPWLRLIDTLFDVTNFALGAKTRRSQGTDLQAGLGQGAGQLETRLAGVVVAALKEAFDRDSSRLELERERLERERERAERALKLELLRQAGEREIGRLRVVAGVAFASLIGTLFVVLRLGDGAVGARVMVGAGWLLLLAALALSFSAQSSVGRALARLDEASIRPEELVAGSAASWLIVCGLGAIGIGTLIV